MWKKNEEIKPILPVADLEKEFGGARACFSWGSWGDEISVQGLIHKENHSRAKC